MFRTSIAAFENRWTNTISSPRSTKWTETRYSGSICDDVGWPNRRKYTTECINRAPAYSMMYTPRHDVLDPARMKLNFQPYFRGMQHSCKLTKVFDQDLVLLFERHQVGRWIDDAAAHVFWFEMCNLTFERMVVAATS